MFMLFRAHGNRVLCLIELVGFGAKKKCVFVQRRKWIRGRWRYRSSRNGGIANAWSHLQIILFLSSSQIEFGKCSRIELSATRRNRDHDLCPISIEISFFLRGGGDGSGGGQIVNLDLFEWSDIRAYGRLVVVLVDFDVENWLALLKVDVVQNGHGTYRKYLGQNTH